MTVAIALKCKDGLVVACDSRTTKLYPTTSRAGSDTARKLHLVKLQDGNSFVIAEAGSTILASRLIQAVLTKASSATLTDRDSVRTVAENAIAALRQEIRTQCVSDEDFDKYLKDYDCTLMLAHYFNAEPFVFTFNPHSKLIFEVPDHIVSLAMAEFSHTF